MSGPPTPSTRGPCPTTRALAEAMDKHSVFGRVTPHQKRAVVRPSSSGGHVVAMTGDGVNDALASRTPTSVSPWATAPRRPARSRSSCCSTEVRPPARRRRRGTARDRQHRAGRQPVPGEERLLAGPGVDHRHHPVGLPAGSHPAHPDLHGHHRRARFRVGARAEQAALCSWLPSARPALRDPDRNRHWRRRIPGLLGSPGSWIRRPVSRVAERPPRSRCSSCRCGRSSYSPAR